MARPPCPRRVAAPPPFSYFKPAGVPVASLQEVALSVDEFEALRLADLLGLYQDEAARRMGMSRATFARIVEASRRKVAEALVPLSRLLPRVVGAFRDRASRGVSLLRERRLSTQRRSRPARQGRAPAGRAGRDEGEAAGPRRPLNTCSR